MKAYFFFLAASVLVLPAAAQTGVSKVQTGRPAEVYQTFLVQPASAVRVPPPPGLEASRAERREIRKRMAALDTAGLKAIRYWNAGAPAYRWNEVAGKLVSWDNPDLVLRFPSTWMNIAIYDATVLAWQEKEKYKRSRPAAADAAISPLVPAPASYAYPCEYTVTAAAAAYVLGYFYPAQKDSLLELARTASRSRIDAGLQYPSDVEAAWKLGEQVAMQVIERARRDGSDLKWDGKKNTDPQKWTGAYPLGITKALHRPMVLRSADQFRPAPPPDFAAEMAEMKHFKRTFASNTSAYFWANTPYGYWYDIANRKMFENRMADDPRIVAKIYTLLGIAGNDAAIATMDAKYAYWGIRPVQYDTTYKPLIATPPFPGYPSGHALGAGASAAVLSYFFPEDSAYFQQLAEACAESRFYAGIHFRTDNAVGLQMGREIGKYVVQAWMKR